MPSPAPTRIPLSRLGAAPCWVALLALTGCYQSIVTGELGEGGVTDGGRPDLPDGAVLPDMTLDMAPDGDVPDFGFDMVIPPVDMGLDMPIDLDVPDIPPVPSRPPNPNTCRIEPTIFPFDDPVPEYTWPEGDVVHPAQIHVSMTPLVADLTPDAGAENTIDPKLIFVSYGFLSFADQTGILRIVDPVTNETVSYPAEEGEVGVLEATTNLAVGDLDGDGENEIVGLGPSAATFAFRSDGTLWWVGALPRAIDRGTLLRTISGGPTIADLDADGRPEVIVGRGVLNGEDGSIAWDANDDYGSGTNELLGPMNCVADIDNDGFQEVIAGNSVFEHDGEEKWFREDIFDGFCAVADILPEEPGPEIVLVSRGFLRLLDNDDGSELFSRRLEGRGPSVIGGAPTVADFDGDGRAEIGVAHGTAYAVYDPECVASDPACAGNDVLWRSDTRDASSAGTGSSVFDFNGDGRAEVIYNDETYFRVYDGRTGDTLFDHQNSSRTRIENPSIADVDNDGDAEIVFPANAEADFIFEFWTDPGVEVWGDRRGRWVGARRIWNQHSYYITNVEEDGSIPTRPAKPWEGDNNYRQNLIENPERDVLIVPDLWSSQGTFECLAPGRARLTVEVFNYGLENAGAGAVVGFYRGDPDLGERVGEAMTTRPLLPRGDSEIVSIEVDLTGEVVDYYAVLDDPVFEDPETESPTGSIFECRENNNEILVWRPFCP
ncbi:MAG: VCBS repeat-containing protein [Myxococcota bacterium]